jgi:nucleotidyltransferase/DNA polymerase involved in DNA repair
VIVGGDPRARGVVSAASYEARASVHSAMPLRRRPRSARGAPSSRRRAKCRRESRRVMESWGGSAAARAGRSTRRSSTWPAGLFGPRRRSPARSATRCVEVGLTARSGCMTARRQGGLRSAQA